MVPSKGWLQTSQALALLKVRPQTLYAYVSRGRIHARPDPEDPRRSLYSQPDVERLAKMSRAARRPSAVAASTIAWGEPMLASALSTVKAGRLIYRGEDAVALSRLISLEATAALLWNAPEPVFTSAEPAPPTTGEGASVRIFSALAPLAAAGPPLRIRAPSAHLLEASELMRTLARAATETAPNDAEPVHDYLARAWAAPEAAPLLRRALVLLADHELNVSTFAVRVTASTGASLAACLLSGLCALSGPLHGGAGLAVARLAAAMSQPDPEGRLAALYAERRALPGFGHPLYAGEDVRAAALLEAFEPTKAHAALRRRVGETLQLSPNVDFALSALTARFNLPTNAPFLVFALARSVGWIAHALEQNQTGDLIRPRARYVGPPAQDRDVARAGAAP